MAVTAERPAGWFGRRVVGINAYWTQAIHAFRCEGLNPLADRPRFAEEHTDIAKGDRFLRKVWETREGVEFYARHCRACAQAIGVRG